MKLYESAEHRQATQDVLSLLKILLPMGTDGKKRQGVRAAALIGALAVLYWEDFCAGKEETWTEHHRRKFAQVTSLAIMLTEDLPIPRNGGENEQVGRPN